MNISRTLALAALSIASLSTCHKPEESTITHELAAYVNGGNFSATSVSYFENLTSTRPYIEVYGNDNDGQLFIILYQTSMLPGTLQFNSIDAYMGYIKTGSGSQTSVNGHVTVTSLTPEIEGTFECTLRDSTKITNGRFKAVSR